MKKLWTTLIATMAFMLSFAQISTTGLIAYYPLGNTNYKDYSGNGYNADSSGCACTQEVGRNSLPNTSTRFGQGSTDAVLYNYFSNPTPFQNQTFTLSAWVYMDAVTPTNGLSSILTMGDNDIYLRFTNNAGVLNLQYGYRRTGGFVGGIVAVTSANYLNTWKLVSLTRNSSGLLQLYVDGVAVSSTVNTTSIAYGTSNRIFRIGNVWTGDQQFEGRIQDVFYYNDAISLTPFLCTAVPPASNTPVANLSVCNGGSTTLSLSNPNSLQVWYPTSVGGNPLATGGTFTTPNLTTTTTYWVEQAGSPGNCRSYARVPITVTITPSTPPAAPVNATQSFFLSRCGTNTTNLTVTATGTVNWYNQSTGGTSLGTGTTFTTPALPNTPGPGQTTTVTYYAEASSGCGTSVRTPINITVNYQYSAQNTTPPANLNICAGTSTVLTGTSNAPNVEWYLNQPPFTTLSTTTSYTTPVLNANASYSFRAIDPSSNQCSFAVTVPVTVGAAIPAAPTNTTTASNTTICAGQSAVLTVTGTGTISWYSQASGGTVLGTGTTFTTPYLPNIASGPGQTAPLTYYAEAGSSCGNSARTPITINVKYQYANPVNTTPASNLTICSGTSTTLSVSTTAPSVDWYEGFTQLPSGLTLTTPILTANTTFDAITSGPECYSYIQITVNVVSTPASAPTNTTVTPALTVCRGSSTTLTASGSGTLYWFDVPTNGTNLGSGTSFNTGALTANKTFYVQSGLGACASSRVAVTVVVNALPTAAIAPATLAICNGQSATLTASGGTSFVWSNSGGNSAAATFSPTTNTTYTVTVTNANNCSATAVRSVTVNVNPTATISPATATICSGTSASLTASGGTAYAWSNSGGSNAAATFSPTTNTTYTVTITNANNCSATASRLVTVNANPTAAISPATVAICNGASATLTVSGGTQYAWSNSGGSNAAATFSPTTNTTYTVTVTNAANCSATASRLVTVNANPTAAISPTTVAICNGASATLTASGGTAYAWSNSGGSNAAATFSPTANTAYTVTVTNATNCSATASRLVTVNAIPNVAINGPTTICSGLSATLTASGGGTYAWSNSGGSNASATFSPTTNTTYTVTVTGTGNCTATASQTISVQSAPTATIAGPSSVCAGSSVTLTANGGNTYAWSTSASSADITVSPSATTTYTVTVSIGANCSATATKSISVNANPTAGITTVIPSVCPGNSIALTATGGDTYTWSNGGGNNALANFTPTAATTYSVTVANAANCTATASIAVTIRTAPVAVVSPAAAVICQGESVTLIVSGGTGGAWNNGLGSGTIKTVSPTQTTTYIATATNANACSDTASVTVVVNPSPTSTINASICSGQSYNFDGQGLTQAGQYFDTLQTTFGCDSFIVLNLVVNTFVTGSINKAICQGETFTFNGQALMQQGQYLDTLISSGGCDSIVTLTLTVNSLPQPTITQNGFDLSTQTFASYQWQLNSSDINGAENQSYTAPANGNYTVQVTDANGCSGISAITNVTGVGINHITEIAVSIYPNPASDKLIITTTEVIKSLEITDMVGRKVLSSDHVNELVDISSLSSARYMILLKTAKGIQRISFTKE